jgi:CheY-like chemotaxis protein
MSQTLVLSIGSQLAVLDTRELILRSAGYIVVSAISIEEAVRFFQDGDFDLIVLCHTLPTKECERLTSLIRASGSRIPIVSVSGTAGGEQNAFADATVDQDSGRFLRSVGEVLRKHAPTQPVGVRLSRNNGVGASAEKAVGSNTGFDRCGNGVQGCQGTSVSLSAQGRMRTLIDSLTVSEMVGTHLIAPKTHSTQEGSNAGKQTTSRSSR